jgi:hypothetical protein
MFEYLFGETGGDDDLIAMVKKYAASGQNYDGRMVAVRSRWRCGKSRCRKAPIPSTFTQPQSRLYENFCETTLRPACVRPSL